jgi:hypothetical protein
MMEYGKVDAVPGTQCVGGWVGPQSRSGRRGEEKNVEPRLLGRSARSQSL